MKLPASPPGWWLVIGRLHALGPAPHKSIAQLSQKCGPLMFLQLGTKPHVVVSSPELAKEIFKHHDLTFSHRPYMAIMDRMNHINQGFSWIPNNNASWRKLRKIFTAKAKAEPRNSSGGNEESLKSILGGVTVNPKAPIGIYSKVEIKRMVVDVLSRIMLSRRFESSHERTAMEKTGGATIEEFSYVCDKTSQLAQGGFFIGDYILLLSWLDIIGGKRKHAAAIQPRLQDLMAVNLNEHRAKKRNGALHVKVGVNVDMVDVPLSHQEMEGEDSLSEGMS